LTPTTVTNSAIHEEDTSMTTAHRWIVLAGLIGAVLGGAYVIVERNNPALNASVGAMPSGAFH